jgi:hypothetical protein
MSGIPDSVSAVRLICLESGRSLPVTTKPGSCCHFAERLQHGAHEIGLRIDWSDPDGSGDPTLDADFFTPGATKRLREPRFNSVHHTSKALVEGQWVYDFAFDPLRLRLLFEVTHQRHIQGRARIVRPDS